MGKANLPENATSEKYAKQMPSSFTHFYCRRVVLSPKKKVKIFFNISGRLGKIQPLKILSVALSFNLSCPPKIRAISGPCHLYHMPLNDAPP